MKTNKNNLMDSLTRLQKYYTYFSNKDFILDEDIEEGCSISKLHKHLSIPVIVIRRDIASILSMPENGYIWFDTDTYDIDSIGIGYLCKEVVSGTMDDIPIISALPFYYTSSEIPISIKNSDIELLSRYTNKNLTGSVSSDPGYRIKSSYRFHHSTALTERLISLNEAIASTCAVKLRYHDPKNKKDLNLEVFPVQLLYDATNNIYSVVAAYDDFKHLYTYRLDRMIYVSINKAKSWDPSSNEHKAILQRLNYAPIIWDGNYDEIKPVHVKISFENTGNVWDKVKRDLAYRTNGTLTESVNSVFGKKEAVLVYEDDVSGMNSFRSWLLGYGRSAYIHHPETLKESMKTILKKRIISHRYTLSISS